MDALRWEFLGVALKNVKLLSLNYSETYKFKN